ncbi:hypothetical protein ABBQ38_000965 [Trebouxia sp. C0009 RCD-2024]
MFSVESNPHTLAEKQSPNSIKHEAPVSSNKRERSGCLLAFDWILRPWHYFNTIPRAVAYLVAGSGFYGGILFVIGSFAGCSPAVANSYTGPDGLKTQYDWLVLFIFMVGTYVFTVGCSLLYVDANNAAYPHAMATWKATGRLGKRPRHPAAVSTAGCHSPDVVDKLVELLGWRPLLCGVSACLPSRASTASVLHRSSRGCFLNYYPNAIPFHPTYQIENGINYGGGSFCFLMSGLLMYIQMSIRDEDTLPLSLPPQARDSISRTSPQHIEDTPSQQVHRDDSARVSKGVHSIIS